MQKNHLSIDIPPAGASSILSNTYNYMRILRNPNHQSEMLPWEYYQDTPGPADYNPWSNQIYFSKRSDCRTPFQSKVQRFKQEPHCIIQSNQFQIEECKTKEIKGIRKKLIDMKQSKVNSPKLLPSIPINQNSFGYKQDPQTHKLIENTIPNMMLDLTNSDFHRRVPSQQKITWNRYRLQKILMNRIQRKQKTNPQQNQIPIREEKLQTKINNAITSHEQRFKQNGNHKNVLLIHKYIKLFKNYIQQNTNQINKLIHKNKQQSQIQIKSAKNIKQCFLSGENRFKHNQLKNSFSIDYNNQTKTNKKCKNGYVYFGGKGDRFTKTRIGHKLGPGSYQKSRQFESKNGVPFKLQQKRFKQNKKLNSAIPGPGTYDFKQRTMKKRITVPRKLNVSFQLAKQIVNHKRPLDPLQLHKLLSSTQPTQQIMESLSMEQISNSFKDNSISQKKVQKDMLNKMKELIQLNKENNASISKAKPTKPIGKRIIKPFSTYRSAELKQIQGFLPQKLPI